VIDDTILTIVATILLVADFEENETKFMELITGNVHEKFIITNEVKRRVLRKRFSK